VRDFVPASNSGETNFSPLLSPEAISLEDFERRKYTMVEKQEAQVVQCPTCGAEEGLLLEITGRPIHFVASGKIVVQPNGDVWGINLDEPDGFDINDEEQWELVCAKCDHRFPFPDPPPSGET